FFFTRARGRRRFRLSLHDALPISHRNWCFVTGACHSTLARHSRSPSAKRDHGWRRFCAASPRVAVPRRRVDRRRPDRERREVTRSEEHTSELQSLAYLVCRLLPEK